MANYQTSEIDYSYILCDSIQEARSLASNMTSLLNKDIVLIGYASQKELLEEVSIYHNQMDPVDVLNSQDEQLFAKHPKAINLCLKIQSWLFKLLLVLAFLSPVLATRVEGQTVQQSPWKEVQVVEIPSGQTLHEGVTKNGNPKYWFDFKGLQVTVSLGNATKYKTNEVTLVLVKWQHKDTGNYKYSTRQKDKPKSEPVNIDITTLF